AGGCVLAVGAGWGWPPSGAATVASGTGWQAAPANTIARVVIQRIAGSSSPRSSPARRIVPQPDNELAEIAALEQPDKRLGRPIEAVDDVFAIFELAALQERCGHRPIFAEPLPLIADDEPLDAQPPAHRRRQIGARPRFQIIVFRDHAAHDHAAEIVEPREHRLLDRPADILPIDVDPFGTVPVECRAEIRRTMIDACVEAELGLDIAAFIGAAGDAHDTRTGAFGELARDRADSPRGRRDDDGLAALRPADLAQSDIGREPRHAEHAERGRERRLGRIELEEGFAGNRAIELPAIAAQ